MIENLKFKIENSERGVAVLAMVIVVVSVMALIGVSIATTSFFESASGKSEAKAEETLRVAEAGIQDALFQLSRNIDFLCNANTSSATCTLYGTGYTACNVNGTNDGYSLAVGNGTVCIRINNPANCPDTGQTIVVRGAIDNKVRKIQVTYDMDCYGAVTQTAWAELTS